MEGLNFFDFSFFVSGFVTYFALLYFIDEVFGKCFDYKSVVGIVAAIIIIYVCGIVSFTIGKWIRFYIRKFRERTKNNFFHVQSFIDIYEETIKWVLQNQKKTMPGVNREQLQDQLSLKNTEDMKTLQDMAYSAMWIEIRNLDKEGEYYNSLYRQWVMQAVCEGLIFSFMLIMILSLISFFAKSYEFLYMASFVLALACFLASCREAQRYAENQIKEVIVSYYFLKYKKKEN